MNVVDLDPSIEAMADQLKLFADKTRLTIVALLRERELCVCDIAALLAISQPAVSQHLKKMRLAGLLAERRQGQWAYYSLRLDGQPHLKAIVDRLPFMRLPESCNSDCCE
jgi:ArsR family transcriptional regulator